MLVLTEDMKLNSYIQSPEEILEESVRDVEPFYFDNNDIFVMVAEMNLESDSFMNNLNHDMMIVEHNSLITDNDSILNESFKGYWKSIIEFFKRLGKSIIELFKRFGIFLKSMYDKVIDLFKDKEGNKDSTIKQIDYDIKKVDEISKVKEPTQETINSLNELKKKWDKTNRVNEIKNINEAIIENSFTEITENHIEEFDLDSIVNEDGLNLKPVQGKQIIFETKRRVLPTENVRYVQSNIDVLNSIKEQAKFIKKGLIDLKEKLKKDSIELVTYTNIFNNRLLENIGKIVDKFNKDIINNKQLNLALIEGRNNIKEMVDRVWFYKNADSITFSLVGEKKLQEVSFSQAKKVVEEYKNVQEKLSRNSKSESRIVRLGIDTGTDLQKNDNPHKSAIGKSIVDSCKYILEKANQVDMAVIKAYNMAMKEALLVVKSI